MKTNFENFLNENVENTDITIEKIDLDPRSNTNRKEDKFSVNYQKMVDGDLIEIEGTLNPFDTGRMIDYNFEPNWFSCEKCEEFYYENYEDIES